MAGGSIALSLQGVQVLNAGVLKLQETSAIFQTVSEKYWILQTVSGEFEIPQTLSAELPWCEIYQTVSDKSHPAASSDRTSASARDFGDCLRAVWRCGQQAQCGHL